MRGLFKRGVTWYIRYPVGGKRKWEAVGPSKRQAELVLAKRRVEIREGQYFSTPQGLKWTYGQLLDRYLEFAKVAKRASTYKTDTFWAKHLREAFGGRLLKDVTPDVVAAYLEGKLALGLAPATVAHHLALLKHSFTMAVKWKLLRAHPLREVLLPVKVNNARLRYLMPDEISRLLANCAEHLRPMVLTALHTGMRKGEVVGLRWEQVDLRNKLLLLTQTKSGGMRGVPLNETMVSTFGKMRAKQEAEGVVSPFVFVNRMTGLAYRRDADSAWYTALKKAKLEDVHFHDLRHTAASHLRMKGADLLTVQEILGHRDLKMTARYAHVGVAHKLAAVALLEQAYQSPPPQLQTDPVEEEHAVASEAAAAAEWQQNRQQAPETMFPAPSK